VIRKTVLPVLALMMTLAACSNQAPLVSPALPASANAPVSLVPSPSEPSIAATPVPTITSTPVPPALPVVATVELGRIDFQDEKNGWGIAVNDHGYILRTVDGGSTWLNASPGGIAPIGLSTNLATLNATTAWVLVPGMDFFSGTIYRTSDGGVTWISNPVPFGDGFLQFLDANNGRILTDRGSREGSEAVEIFQSSDGGATWVSVFHDDPSQPGFSDGLPLAGIKNGMTFLDNNIGWVTGSNQENGSLFLYVTHDGGASWRQQSVPLPPDFTPNRYLTQAPVFFGKDGFLPLMVYRPDRTDLTFYVTHDGGLTWSGDPSDVRRLIKPGLPACADALHIWSWDGSTALYRTSDGARVWQEIATSLDLSGRLSQLEFVPSPAGRFTGWALTRLDDSGHSQLYRTADGSTWTQIVP
jgi:photosystem II stability/assembly factor-like uncharacterized protein